MAFNFLTVKGGGNKEWTVWFQWAVLVLIMILVIVTMVYTLPISDMKTDIEDIKAKTDLL